MDKMQRTLITLHPEVPAEKPMRDILGICNTPRIRTKAILNFEKPYFDALHFRHIRYHDAPLENPGQQLIDIHRIFPLFHLDENDPRNYFFAQTDDYLAVVADSDAEIDFRLGETIDHSGNARLIGVPEDIDKWARVCRNIIGHYKNGEMNGMHCNITRVTVWEEPDNPRLLSGTVEQYVEMFCTVYQLLKKDFPDLKVGGPTSMFRCNEFLEKFLSLCQERGVTPDYVCGTFYPRSIEDLIEAIGEYREIMDRNGCAEVGYVLSEWHLGPYDWKNTASNRHGFCETISAAFTASTLIRLLDIDYIEAAYYYAWATGNWGVINPHKPERELLPVYYGLLFFQKLATECAQRIPLTLRNEKVDQTVGDSEGVYALAGRTADGKIRLLISCYEVAHRTIVCQVPGATKGTLRKISEVYRESECLQGEPICAENGVFEVKLEGCNGVFLLELDD